MALVFDFLNGLHDAANLIATIVSTRVLRPQYAVFWAAFFNFIAFMFFGLHVAKTVGSGIVAPDLIDDFVILGALTGAIAWNVITWLGGIPSSSSHALIGGIVGAGMAKAGFGAVLWSGLGKTVAAIVLSPATGFFLAIFFVFIVAWSFVKSPRFCRRDIPPAAIRFSVALFTGPWRQMTRRRPWASSRCCFTRMAWAAMNSTFTFWVVLSCKAAMALGTLFGGWRIVHTMGSKITRLSPMQGFCAETAGAITLFGATAMGIPVSTTHTITGAIVGVGASRRVSAVRWNIAQGIVVAWVITLPMSALIAALAYWISVTLFA